MNDYSLTFHATIPVEPFRLDRTVTVYRHREYVPVAIRIEVNHVSVNLDASDHSRPWLKTLAHRIKQDGTPYKTNEGFNLDWDELPEQARQAIRDAYQQAAASALLELEIGKKPDCSKKKSTSSSANPWSARGLSGRGVRPMSADWPRESDATVAVEAAAKKAYDDWRQAELSNPEEFPEWEDVPAIHQLRFRNSVLRIVWAALEALPDPRREAWDEGYLVAQRDDIDERDLSPNPYGSAE